MRGQHLKGTLSRNCSETGQALIPMTAADGCSSQRGGPAKYEETPTALNLLQPSQVKLGQGHMKARREETPKSSEVDSRRLWSLACPSPLNRKQTRAHGTPNFWFPEDLARLTFSRLAIVAIRFLSAQRALPVTAADGCPQSAFCSETKFDTNFPVAPNLLILAMACAT